MEKQEMINRIFELEEKIEILEKKFKRDTKDQWKFISEVNNKLSEELEKNNFPLKNHILGFFLFFSYFFCFFHYIG